ncbi:hypothetical protein LB505_000280 [Fusarium chuoi]|nr:hypothetical protein LB505_000280 [Fusarium chuoi]
MNIGGGSIADQVELSKRGFVMSIFFTGYFLGPVIGSHDDRDLLLPHRVSSPHDPAETIQGHRRPYS